MTIGVVPGAFFVAGQPSAALAMAWAGAARAGGAGLPSAAFPRSVFSRDPLGGIQKFVCLGDVHSKWRAVQQILDHEFPEGNGIALSVGDLGSYPVLEGGHSVYFVHGNHENFATVGALHSSRTDAGQRYRPIFAGDVVELGGLAVAGVPGVHSEYYFEQPDIAPLRYFTRRTISAMRELGRPVDILLMHDAPSGIGLEKDGRPLGDTHLAGIVDLLRPGLVLFGHHHRRFFKRLDETRVVGLDYPRRSYVIIEYDPSSRRMIVTERYARMGEGREAMKGFKYDWNSTERGCICTVFDRRVLVGREREIFTRLNETLRGQIYETVAHYISKKEAREEQCSLRTDLALNTAIPFAAHYAAAFERGPSLNERQTLLRQIHKDMLEDTLPGASDDILFAFGECLKALGLV